MYCAVLNIRHIQHIRSLRRNRHISLTVILTANTEERGQDQDLVKRRWMCQDNQWLLCCLKSAWRKKMKEG